VTCIEKQIVGSLLKGGSLLFGMPVELAWPEGLPRGWTADDLRVLGSQMTAGEPAWMPAVTEYCVAGARCARPLTGGECEIHGTSTPVVALPPEAHVTETWRGRTFCAGCTEERNWFTPPERCRLGPRPARADAGS